VISELEPSAVRYQGDRPVAVGGQELGQPTTIRRTAAGFWGVYAAGDEAIVVHPGGALRGRPAELRERLQGMAGERRRADDDREAAGSMLAFLGGDDPGAAEDVPRSPAERGEPPPPTYRLSDPTNSPRSPADQPTDQAD
jgi:hypothetical protein